MQCAKDVTTNIQNRRSFSTSGCRTRRTNCSLARVVWTALFLSERQYDYYQHAQSVTENTAIQHFKVIAKELKVVLPISFYEKDGNVLYNSIAVIDADGEVLGVLSKDPHNQIDHYYQEKILFHAW